MLKIYHDLFQNLNSSGISYYVYKSLNYLDDDLNGDRGDIDIIIEASSLDRFVKIAQRNGFQRVIKQGSPYYFVGLDISTHKSVLLDVNTKIQVGQKPFKPHYFNIDVTQLSGNIQFEIVSTLNVMDYVPLMFIMRILSPSKKMEDLEELKYLCKTTTFIKSYMINLLKDKFRLDWKDIVTDIFMMNSWDSLKLKYQRILEEHIKTSLLLKVKSRYIFGYRIKHKIKRIIGVPAYRVRKKGYMVAFVGVDGSGKTSSIEYLSNLSYFKNTGSKKIYFGSNNYWIPFLKTGLVKCKNKAFRTILSLVTTLDMYGRMLFALCQIKMGKIVFADRYVYDSYISRYYNPPQGRLKQLKKIYRYLFSVKLLRIPEVIIFLNVSPEIAYQRKQDYPFEKMLEVNANYKEYMGKVGNVNIVNSDKREKDVLEEIITIIRKAESANDLSK